jgi:hypothetical protein
MVALLTLNSANGQSCLPEGITFSTQAQIDSFPINHPNCTQLEGDVTISGSNIVNLLGLNGVISIGGDLNIEENYALISLTGLEGLTSIAGNLDIFYNNALTSLMGLENVTSIGGNLYIYHNDSLTSMTTACPA